MFGHDRHSAISAIPPKTYYCIDYRKSSMKSGGTQQICFQRRWTNARWHPTMDDGKMCEERKKENTAPAQTKISTIDFDFSPHHSSAVSPRSYRRNMKIMQMYILIFISSFLLFSLGILFVRIDERIHITTMRPKLSGLSHFCCCLTFPVLLVASSWLVSMECKIFVQFIGSGVARNQFG